MKSEIVENVPSKSIAPEVNPVPILGVKESLEPAATNWGKFSFITFKTIKLILFQN